MDAWSRSRQCALSRIGITPARYRLGMTAASLVPVYPDAPPRIINVPAALVRSTIDQLEAGQPAVHPIVQRSLRGSRRTASARLERLARVAIAADIGFEHPVAVWQTDWSRLNMAMADRLARTISTTWHTPSTRNAARDAVRAVIKAAQLRGDLSADDRDRLLDVFRPEPIHRDPDRVVTKVVVPREAVQQAFARCRADGRILGRRDAAVIATLLGCGLRRAELCSLDTSHLSRTLDLIVNLQGKGGRRRTIPVPPGTRAALVEWLEVRGEDAGALFCATDRRGQLSGRRLDPGTVRQILARRFVISATPHQMRSTWISQLLDSGADLAIVAQLAGHADPSTTLGYDRRGLAAKQRAISTLDIGWG